MNIEEEKSNLVIPVTQEEIFAAMKEMRNKAQEAREAKRLQDIEEKVTAHLVKWMEKHDFSEEELKELKTIILLEPLLNITNKEEIFRILEKFNLVDSVTDVELLAMIKSVRIERQRNSQSEQPRDTMDFLIEMSKRIEEAKNDTSFPAAKARFVELIERKVKNNEFSDNEYRELLVTINCNNFSLLKEMGGTT